MSHDLKAIVSGNNKARFSHYRDGNFFYVVKVEDRAYRFPIPLEDAKGGVQGHNVDALDSPSPGGQNLPARELAPGRPGGQRPGNGKL